MSLLKFDSLSSLKVVVTTTMLKVGPAARNPQKEMITDAKIAMSNSIPLLLCYAACEPSLEVR